MRDNSSKSKGSVPLCAGAPKTLIDVFAPLKMIHNRELQLAAFICRFRVLHLNCKITLEDPWGSLVVFIQEFGHVLMTKHEITAC